jgi:hypothetical protein
MAYIRDPNDKPSTYEGGIYPNNFGGELILQAMQAFNDDIRNSGVAFVHYACLPCPVGRISKNDTLNKPHEDHSGCQNGHIYYKVGIVTALFTGNTKSPRYTEGETIQGSSAQMTTPTHYDDQPDRPVIVSVWDRFQFCEPPFQVMHFEQIDHSETGNDRLKFPAVKVEALIDNRGVSYQHGKDYCIDQFGDLNWVKGPGAASPGIDPDTGFGRLYSIRYLYNPFYYVSNLGHETRVLPVMGPNGKKQVHQAPRQFTVERENTYRMADNNPETPKATKEAVTRQVRAPSSGGFSPK